MENELKDAINKWLGDKVDTVGFAPAERFDEAPEDHRPEKMLKGARAVIVLGKTVPRALLKKSHYELHNLQRCYHSVYEYLNALGLELCNWIEERGDYFAVPVPTFAPMTYHGLEPWGLLSLKHCAVNAGLGSFGKNGLMHHPKYGTMLRLGAVVTTAELPGDPVIEADPCPPECNACFNACPHHALKDGDRFDKMKCLLGTIRHGIYPLALKDQKGLDNIEMIINTAGYNYWIGCNTCLKVCPSNKVGRRS
jgi:epoxyqueuosine reductase QueG